MIICWLIYDGDVGGMDIVNISNNNVQNNLTNKKVMSLSKQPSAKPPRQMQTTLSANILTRSKTNLQKLLRPKISPFQLQLHSQYVPINNSKQLKAVQDINYQYIQLFMSLFQGNRDINGEVVGVGGKLSRQQRYQLECMKILKKTGTNVDKLNKIRNMCRSWEIVAEYLANNKNKQVKSKSEYVSQAKNLIQNYKQITTQLKHTQQQHEKLYKKNIANTKEILNKDDNKLSQIERQFKRTQRKLNKIMEEEEYYEKKCQQEQARLQQLQMRIKKTEGSKLDIDMKIIGEENKRDRLIRKTREKRDKSLLPTPPDDHNGKAQKITRSKSSLRYQVKNL